MERVSEFKKSLHLPLDKCRDIEMKTRDQSQCSLWYSVRKYRITASYFGLIYHRLPTTAPHSLVLRMLGTSSFTSAATEWGKKNEKKTMCNISINRATLVYMHAHLVLLYVRIIPFLVPHLMQQYMTLLAQMCLV